jgi:acyl-CoA synthetase (AMP-forming)/AMP-acid ligase II
MPTAGSTWPGAPPADWMRVDAVYAVPDEHVGDQVMAALVLNEDVMLTPKQLEEFLAAQPDLSPKAWSRYVADQRRAAANRDQEDPQT